MSLFFTTLWIALLGVLAACIALGPKKALFNVGYYLVANTSVAPVLCAPPGKSRACVVDQGVREPPVPSRMLSGG